MSSRFYSIVLIGWLTAQASLFGQKLSVETSIDTNRITLGDQISLNYLIEKKKDLSVILPDFSDTLVDGIEVIGDPLIDSIKIDKETWRITLGLTITSFDTGIYYIPPQPIVFTEELGFDTLFSRPTYLEVAGVALDSTMTVRDIKSQARVPIALTEILIILIPLLILAAIVYILVRYFRKKNKVVPEIKKLNKEEPPYITALRELDKIKAQKLWQQKQVKEYYTRITHVIRWYIEKRFFVNALEQTTDEILDHISSQRLDHINYANLKALLNLADLVKFAKGNPDPEENFVHLDNAYDFVKKTKTDAEEVEPETEKENSKLR